MHHQMVLEMSGHLDPVMTNIWAYFMNLMAPYLTPVELNQCKNIFDVFEKLLMKGKIDYGKYDIIKEAMKGYNVLILKIINEYTGKMSG